MARSSLRLDQVPVVDQQLQPGVVHPAHQRQPLGDGVDQVGGPRGHRLDQHGDAVLTAQHRRPPGEVQELALGLRAIEALGHLPGLAVQVAQHDHAQAQAARPSQPVLQRPIDLRRIGAGADQLQIRRQEPVTRQRRQPHRLQPGHHRRELRLGQRQQILQRQLQIFEARGACVLGRGHAHHAHTAPHRVVLYRGRQRRHASVAAVISSGMEVVLVASPSPGNYHRRGVPPE